MERPLKLNFLVNEERLNKLRESKTFLDLASSKKRKDSQLAQSEIDEGIGLQEESSKQSKDCRSWYNKKS